MLLVQFSVASGTGLAGPVCGLLIGDKVFPHRAGLSTYDFLAGLCKSDVNARTTQQSIESELFEPAGMAFDDLWRSSRILSPITAPDPRQCLISGTGLTHLGSAQTRDDMHETAQAETTDTRRLFDAGKVGGRPAPGQIGVMPEWFYKGDGNALIAPGGPLNAPEFSLGNGEEPELAMVYIIGVDGCPRRIGSAIGNEFSDHAIEAQNYLYLAHSKLRDCSIGPALRIGDPAADIKGNVSIRRGVETIWERDFSTGESNMTHSLSNIEHHHFKYSRHRIPGDLHIHFLGTSVLSFADEVQVQTDDEMVISAEGYGPVLRNRIEAKADAWTGCKALFEESIAA